MSDGNGNGDNVHDLVPELLRGIRDELRGLRGDVDGLRSDVRQTNTRLDKVIDNTGGHWRDLNSKVLDLDVRLGKLERRRPRAGR